MGLFSRGKSAQDRHRGIEPELDDRDVEVNDLDDEQAGAEPTTAEPTTAEPSTAEPVAPGRRDGRGPLDSSEVTDDSEYLNLGGIWLRGQNGMELRLEVNEQEQQITGVTAVLGESAVQLQAFAAPKSEGVWVDIRNEIADSIVKAGGTAEVRTGEFGEELLTRMPQQGPDGRTVFMPARFLGVDGPRWFLRAVVSGRAAIEPGAAAAVHDVIRTAVVDRGEEARPPRELLPLRLPDSAPAEEQAAPEEPGAPRVSDLKPFERGPEITEVR